MIATEVVAFSVDDDGRHGFGQCLHQRIAKGLYRLPGKGYDKAVEQEQDMNAQPAINARALLLAARSLDGDGLRSLIGGLLDSSGLSRDERVELLGGLFVSEAVRPYWESGLEADAAHEALLADDPELAGAVEALGPMLLGRIEAKGEARLAIDEVLSILSA